MSSWVQKLLWNVAGAETPILEKCQTDHKKFSAIGATILMTAFIALCAGTSAAWYFTQKGTDESGAFGWSLAFGIIWATLIFCIDRSLVITLKKKEDRKVTWWVVPFISRAALAIIVAFMVSIPLELVIFEDYIKGNEENFEANQIAILGDQLKSNSGEDVLNTRISDADVTLKKLDKEATKLGKEADELQKKINNLEAAKKNPQSKAFRDAQSRFNTASQNYNTALSKYNEYRRLHPDAISNPYTSQKNNASSAKSSASSDMAVARRAWVEEKQAEINKLIPQRDAKIAEKQQKDQTYNTTLTSQLSDKGRAQEAASQREIKEASKQEKLAKGNHFIKNFQILEYSVWQRDKDGNLTDSTQLMFLWLVRVLFFIVEILPTVVKIVSPVGSYERMIAAEEKNLIEYMASSEYCDMIKNIHKLALSSQEELQQQQHDAEIDLKKSILYQIKAAQMEVAQLAIEKWKEQEKAKLTPPVVRNSSTTGNDEDDDNMTTFV